MFRFAESFARHCVALASNFLLRAQKKVTKEKGTRSNITSVFEVSLP